MTPDQIKLVQESWAKVRPISVQAAELFYGRLFETDPTLKGLFKGNMADQGAKLMSILGTAVGALNKLDTVLPAVQQLGKKHVSYGVKKEHYITVGAALLWTLDKGLGDAFTPEVKEAWTVVYTALSNVMTEAAGYADESAA